MQYVCYSTGWKIKFFFFFFFYLEWADSVEDDVGPEYESAGLVLRQHRGARLRPARWAHRTYHLVDTQVANICFNAVGKPVLRIRDVYPGSRIQLFSIPDPNCLHPGSRTRIKGFKGSDQRENRRVWSNINTRYLVWRCGDGRSFLL